MLDQKVNDFLPLASSSFTNSHLGFEVLGGYFSCVSDAYKKKGLAPASHRVRMCELGVKDDKWLMVDPWEAESTSYIPTVSNYCHFC